MEYFASNALFILVLLFVADFVSTMIALKKGAVEANPVLNWLALKFNAEFGTGPKSWMFVKGISDGLAILLLSFAGPTPVALVVVAALIALHVWAVVNNVRVIKR